MKRSNAFGIFLLVVMGVTCFTIVAISSILVEQDMVNGTVMLVTNVILLCVVVICIIMIVTMLERDRKRFITEIEEGLGDNEVFDKRDKVLNAIAMLKYGCLFNEIADMRHRAIVLQEALDDIIRTNVKTSHEY
jgi:hypothetical protein